MKLRNPNGSSCALWPVFRHVIILCSLSLIQPTSTTGSALGNDTDRVALLKFKESISNDPHGVLSSWNDSIHFCNWLGITCGNRHQRITALNLKRYNLRGTMSPYVGNLTFLRFINLEQNSFFGEIPLPVGRLFRLQHLNLSDNMLEGKIPVNLSYCSNLKILRLGINKLSGMIPPELGALVNLVQLNLTTNNLTGGIPPSFGNISSLRVFSAGYNNLAGNIPNEFGKLRSLTFFSIGSNNLSGTIPLSLYNMSSMRTFIVAENHFIGTLPPDIGLTLPNLQGFGLGANKISGTIPESISNASQLQIFEIGDNDFFGQVPANLGNLRDLKWLGLNFNSLGNYSSNSLDFIPSLANCSQMEELDLSYNKFGGVLPHSIANLSTQLTKLFLGGNQISGNIPTTLENLVSLIMLSMPDNLFTGDIPSFLGKLQNLQVLQFYQNSLSGEIPSLIGNLSQLFELNLGHNRLEGRIPPSIANCQSLTHLDLSNNNLIGDVPREIFGTIFSFIALDFSQNSLTGSLPVEVGKLKNIYELLLSENKLTGEIPNTIGDCQSLEYLYLEGNFFQGVLPSTLSSLRGLQSLDISQNNFTGEIPKDLQELRFLRYLNLSFNNLEGEVPKEGIFQNTSAISVVGNTKLCGGVPKLQLSPCPVKSSERQQKTSSLKLVIIIIVCVTAFSFAISSFLIFCWRRKSTRKSSSVLSTINFLSNVSYKRLYQATNGFSPSLLIGTGSFGSVYEGILDEKETPVAIKVLNLSQKGASKSFIAECNALRIIRHRNLVKILTCCSSTDFKGNDFKALVFEYMSNGSLEKWLHPITENENQSMSLTLIQRLNIATDVATAVHYLHDHCDQLVIHCDLKPSNVLLDNEMIGHVGDFGLARLVSNTNGFSESQTSTIGIKGTIGY
ncbi:Serine/threonine protein kinase, partial [Trema orientale]